MTIVNLAEAQPPLVLAVDIGTSSLRSLLFDTKARHVEGSLVRRTYTVRTTPDGGAELDAEELFEKFASSLDELLAKFPTTDIAGVATSSMASNVLGADKEGRAITPVYLYSDTRNAPQARRLAGLVDWAPIYARTGCPLHTSYLPSRFSWLRETRPELFGRATQWLSLHEFFLSRLFGRSFISHSLASWTGMFNRFSRDWDDQVVELAGVRRTQLSTTVSGRDALIGLAREYAGRWPALSAARFFPAIGDGAAANLGSGASNPSAVALTIGTSAAVRRIVDMPETTGIPYGLWLYSVDERRGLLGGSLNNGGNAFNLLSQLVRLPQDSEHELEMMEPDGHGLTVLPFFAGERSPGYHAEARAAITGLSISTKPIEIVRACYEAIAYRIAAIFDLLGDSIQEQSVVIASGAALLSSTVWTRVIADVLGRTLTYSGEVEASARGAAMLALEALGLTREASELAPAPGRTFLPNMEHHAIYLRARERHERLYSTLIEGAAA